MVASAASTITATAMLVVASAALVAIVLIGHKITGVSARLGSLEVTATAIKTDTESTARAVNHQPEEGPTLVDRVLRLEDGQRWEHDSLCKIANVVGITLPPSPLDRRTA